MRISVVVPVRNEAGSIGDLLDSLLSQTRLPDEIVITDGGSTDATCEIISDYIKRGSPIRLIREQAALPGRGRNCGAALASSEWIAFTDAGIRADRNWLEALAERASEKSLDVVYGAWEPVLDTSFKLAAAIAYVPPYILVDGVRIRPRFIASALLRRNVWQRVGGFREDLRSGEDLLFMNRVAQEQFRIDRAPRAVVHWQPQPDALGTFRRFATYSRHGMKAGLANEWQRNVSLAYVGLLGLLAVSLIWWPLAILAIVLLLARSQRRVYRWYAAEKMTRRLGKVFNPVIVFQVTWISFVIDMAMFRGMLEWMIVDGCGRSKGKSATPSEPIA